MLLLIIVCNILSQFLSFNIWLRPIQSDMSCNSAPCISPFGSSSSSHLCFSSANRQVQWGEACCQATAQSVWLKLWFPIYHLRDWCGSFPLMLCRAAGTDSCTAAPHMPNESLLWNETFGSHGVGLLHLRPTRHWATPSECHFGQWAKLVAS